MHYRLGTLSLAATTLLLLLTSPLLQTGYFEILSAQAQTLQDREEGDRLLQTGVEQFNKGHLQEALAIFQQALVIYREIGNRHEEGKTLYDIGKTYRALEQYPQALEHYQQSLVIARELSLHTIEISILNTIGKLLREIANEYLDQQHPKAVEFYRQAINIFRAAANHEEEAETVVLLAKLYEMSRQYSEAIEVYQQKLDIDRTLQNREEEASTFNKIANLYRFLGEHSKEIEIYQQILATIRRADVLDFRSGYFGRMDESDVLIALGRAYHRLGQYSEEMESYEQALTVTRAVSDRERMLALLRRIGEIYRQQQQYPEALKVYQQALAIAQEISRKSSDRRQEIKAIINPYVDPDIEVEALIDLSVVYYLLGEGQAESDYYQQALAVSRNLSGSEGEFVTTYRLASIYDDSLNINPKAIELYQQALTLARTINTGRAEIYPLLKLGDLYLLVGPYQKAVESYQGAIEIYKTEDVSSNTRKNINILSEIGIAYHHMGQYAEALQAYQQVLKAPNNPFSKDSRSVTMNKLGTVYRDLGQYQQAIDLHRQALAIAQQRSNRWDDVVEEVVALDNLGITYQALEQHQTAIKFHQQALEMLRWDEKNRNETAITLNNLGSAYQSLKQYQKAIESHQQALAIFQEISNRGGEASALNNLGEAHLSQGQYDKAIAFYQQSLTIKQNIGDREGEGRVLSNLGELLVKQNQPELAIVFYKQAVNVRESIRDNLRPLSEELQQSYAQTVADTYRQLAELLLQQDRVLEAQEVLDLLKLQELEDYLRDVRGNEQTAQGLDFWQPEQQIIQLYKQWIVQNPDSPFVNFVKNPDVTALVGQLQRTARGQNLNPEQLSRLQDNLQFLDNAALLYPLILEDRVELVLVTPSSLVRKTVAVDRVKLNEAIANFRSDITSPSSNPIANAQQLYQWLIQPLEAELEQAQVKTILYAADKQLRYIPLAALHDGKQWLAQRFTVNHITATSLTNFNGKRDRPLQILAAAYSDPQLNYQFQIGENQFSFNGLAFAGVEVETIAKDIPNTTAFFNKDFNRNNVEPRLGEHSIIHLATHAEFVSGLPQESFILFGSGERVTLPEIDEWKLPGVDLVVLSACRTAASGELGSGEEILGFGYQIQRTGAEAAIASLWYVSDGGTQGLMNAFYGALQTGKMTKASALRQAQIALITGEYKALGEGRGLGVIGQTEASLPSAVSNRLSHPYYWAPFILIGNGL
ncbi:MAG: tetratricopeptide repeat protein [Symplocastrum torsivum CPER-KK1]|jgi:CHAT domain-containing protein/tetratricopeptide (TPR) repeat protein|uniref:Tetratricopeptide repeat protein n=1 Tax=Symplocastrum torsivum CPER-KK1 TaxID=450513 RepID=A0A951U7X0_9CYAN|nr:tetratricopeptide repeat protein [Symplocastrum torsivum CPER-KK1]